MADEDWEPTVSGLEALHLTDSETQLNVPEEWKNEPSLPTDPKRTPRHRTLYTSRSLHGMPDKDMVKQNEQPPSDPWARVPRPITKKPSIDGDWRYRAASLRDSKSSGNLPFPLYQFEDVPCIAHRDVLDESSYESGPLTAVATPHGTMSMLLRGHVRIDMTVDQAIRVINFENHIVLAMSATGGSVGLLHPNGRIWQYGSRVEIMANDPDGNNKYAKMSYKGVGFTSDQCALVYLVDAAGTRTTTDCFTDMTFDFTLRLFYEESRHGPKLVQEAMAMLKAAHYWQTDEGEDNWCVNGIRISQTPDGLVKIARNSNKYRMRTSPSNGTASLTTPFMHCTASMGQTQHLFVRRGERRMHFDGSSFIVRNAGHSAGFDEKNQVKVY